MWSLLSFWVFNSLYMSVSISAWTIYLRERVTSYKSKNKQRIQSVYFKNFPHPGVSFTNFYRLSVKTVSITFQKCPKIEWNKLSFRVKNVLSLLFFHLGFQVGSVNYCYYEAILENIDSSTFFKKKTFFLGAQLYFKESVNRNQRYLFRLIIVNQLQASYNLT